MSISISGQNERWAPLSAIQPPTAAQFGQNGSGDSINGSTTPSGNGTAASSPSTGIVPFVGGVSEPLSDNMSFALMAFGGWGSGQASTQTAAQASATSAASATSSASTAQAAITQDGTTSVSQLATDLRALLSTLTGTPTSSTSSSAESNTPAASINTGTAAATALSSTTLKDLQAVESDLDALATSSGVVRPWGSPPPAGPPPWTNTISNSATIAISDSGTTAISNTGTNAASGSGGSRPTYSDGLQQQFALSAYTTGATTGLVNSATSALTGISV